MLAELPVTAKTPGRATKSLLAADMMVLTEAEWQPAALAAIAAEASSATGCRNHCHLRPLAVPAGNAHVARSYDAGPCRPIPTPRLLSANDAESQAASRDPCRS
mmetsp:Transcript_101662/g.152343  ORF Transcript_101662/g.152343 Transcript_101662/m.152343 type:complete len:104 (-) Transcript_101662:398-709(-)